MTPVAYYLPLFSLVIGSLIGEVLKSVFKRGESRWLLLFVPVLLFFLALAMKLSVKG